MCRLIPANNADSCSLCATTGQRKCNHEVALCTNQAVHPNWNSYYYKNAGGIATFQGCGFCKNARKSGITAPARKLEENLGWPGCCYPPTERYYSWIPPQDWAFVAAYHRMEIPPMVRSALDNMQLHRKSRESQRPSIEIMPTGRASQQPVAIPKANTVNGSQPRSYSPGGVYYPGTPGSDRSRHRGSVSSNNSSNSSGSPPSSNGSRRRERDFDGSDRSSPISPNRSNSLDDHPVIKASSSVGSRRTESPGGSARDKDPLTGKRRSNSDPKHQQPPSAYDRQRDRDGMIVYRGESPTLVRDKNTESPTQKRPSPPTSTISSNHPYSNPYSPASSSMKRLNQVEVTSPPRQVLPTPVPRSRENNDPSISSVMANMANMNLNGLTPAALARIQMETKRGVIPPHIRKAGSVISAASGSSSSTNSSAREGTVISDGAFTDYLSDDSDFDLQRQAEVEAENLYQDALRKHEENEFKEARESLANSNRRYGVPNGASRIRV